MTLLVASLSHLGGCPRPSNTFHTGTSGLKRVKAAGSFWNEGNWETLFLCQVAGSCSSRKMTEEWTRDRLLTHKSVGVFPPWNSQIVCSPQRKCPRCTWSHRHFLAHYDESCDLSSAVSSHRHCRTRTPDHLYPWQPLLCHNVMSGDAALAPEWSSHSARHSRRTVSG